MCNICNYKLEIKNEMNQDFYNLLWKYFSLKPGDISIFNPEIIRYIEEYLRENMASNPIKGKNNIKNFDNNIYNFSLYKTGGIMQTLKNIKSNKKIEVGEQDMIYQQLINTQSVELDVEQYQVQHITETSKKFTDGKQLLTYVSEGDSKVRPTHRQLDGTTMLSDDKRWGRIMKELSMWNCRCSIEIADKQILVNPPILGPYKEAYVISDVDVISGKVITFSEQHPVFSNNDPILRKKYKKQTW
jgi:hypothetical protein